MLDEHESVVRKDTSIMLRITQNNAPAGAKSYYTASDYYTEGQELVGTWKGKGADRLGLHGNVSQEDWESLCDNKCPVNGKPLTPRMRANRRVGYDFNFHVPKSVSVLYALTEDERILEAFRDSVDSTMHDIETEMQTRVRTGGKNEDRQTGNMIWGEFVHLTARPVDGVPDPHLHAHCFVFNTTFDEQETRWKAGQFAGLKRDAPYFEAIFHARLAQNLESIGLETKRTTHGWDLAGVPESVNKRFSRRTALIEEKAREDGVTDAASKGELGAKTRQRKQKDLTLGELRDLWLDRMTREELDAIEVTRSQIGETKISENIPAAHVAITHAIGHSFERSAVISERKLLTVAMKHAVGHASPESIADALTQRDLIGAEQSGQRIVTTLDVLEEETEMLAFARDGRGVCHPLGEPDHVFEREWLNKSQQSAVQHVLDSQDRVTLIRGAAGTGKTSMMQETVEALESSGQRVFTFAPSADASRGVLRQEGFENADTVSRLLIDEKLQDEIRGQVIWIDEAGLLSTRSTAKLFDIADRIGARVILSGDRAQHGSVERGAALRLLETDAGLVPAEIRDIQRQKGEYKAAVGALSEGRVSAGFKQLDRMGWIKEVPEAQRYQALAEEYITTNEHQQTALVVSPTHREGHLITEEIRSKLKQSNRLDHREQSLPMLTNVNLTEAQRRDMVNYTPGDVLVFHQNARGYKRGERVVVGDAPLPLDQANRFQVFRPSTLPVAIGERIRITRNGTSLDGKHRLNNGAIYTVKRFDELGNPVLNNGWTVSKEYGHLTHGYVVTSHSSQGKTVDHVIVGQSSKSFPASSREQFYVSVSRGRKQATIYTDDKEALLDAVSNADERLTATELLANGRNHQRHPSPSRRARRALHASRMPDLPPPTADQNHDREGVTHER